ncbi:MAG: sulfurtransferase, partial [Proteobacteria bacterium]|nr:sulfurtransferase [Pseudomonadota bacterium]
AFLIAQVGHPGVAALKGGLDAWSQAGFPLEQG